jgi:hypothetical protein
MNVLRADVDDDALPFVDSSPWLPPNAGHELCVDVREVHRKEYVRTVFGLGCVGMWGVLWRGAKGRGRVDHHLLVAACFC